MGTETNVSFPFGVTYIVEKMGPLRGDGNEYVPGEQENGEHSREDGSPSWGRKQTFTDSTCAV